MKTTAIILLTLSGLVCAQDLDPGITSDSNGDPFTPVGFLQVTPTVVQAGVQPALKWGIEYPKSIPDLVVIDSAGGMTTLNDKSDKLTIRVAGVSYGSEGADLDVALWVRIDNGSWDLVFYGSEMQVDATEAVFTQTVSTGTRVDLAARGRTTGGGWSNVQWTLSQTPNVVAMLDGDPLPADSSAFSTGDVEGFMTQDIDDNGDVEAGPRDIVHVFECGTATPGDSSFDMQDIVVVSSFGRTNNGHGNNEDGVDVSNPGDSTGVGGATDTGPLDENGDFFDDEKSKIKKK